MAMVSWNVRGLNNEEAVRQTRLLIKQHKPDLLFLMETKLAEGKVNKVRNKLGFDEGSNGTVERWGRSYPSNIVTYPSKI